MRKAVVDITLLLRVTETARMVLLVVTSIILAEVGGGFLGSDLHLTTRKVGAFARLWEFLDFIVKFLGS